MHFNPQTKTGPSFADVKQKAHGRWPDILPALGVSLSTNGKHGPCPGCGGTDRFRFDNKDGDGTWICSQGGGDCVAGDGFELLRHCNGWDKAIALREVARIVGDDYRPAKPKKAKPSGTGKLVAEYIYRNESGKPCFGVERWEADGEKTFRQFTKTNGRKVYAVKDIAKLPYRLETWDDQAHTQLWLAEGEKDADRLADLGLRATTNPGGAIAWPDELTSYFKKYNVIILEDNDAAGRKRSELLTRKLLPAADSVKVIRLPDLPDKGDVSDWLDAGHTLDDLLDVAKATKPATLESASRFRWIDTSQPIEAVLDGAWQIKGVMPEQGVGVLFGKPGSGKTFGALDLSLHIAARKPWRGYITHGGTVAYVAMEGGAATINRVIAWKQEHAAVPDLLLTRQAVDLRSSQDDADALIEELQAHNKRKPASPIKLIVIDTLNLALAGGNENQSEDMGAFVTTVKRIAESLSCFVLIVHHSGKDEARGSRGHSSLLGAVDTEFEVKREHGEPGIIKITKQRDGEAGLEFGFDLKSILMGIDTDMQEVTTCVVVEVDAAEVRKAQRTKGGPSGKVQRRVWDALIEQEATSTKSPGVMGIPEGALIVNEDDLRAKFVEISRNEGIERDDSGLRSDFARTLTSLTNGDTIWIKKKGGNVWRA